MQDSYPLPPPPPPPPPFAPAGPANPYAAPVATYSAAPGSLADAERIRHELLKFEQGIRTIGFLYLVLAGFFSVAGLSFLFVAILGEKGLDGAPAGGLGPSAFLLCFFGALGVLYFWVGRGLRRLDSNVRIVAIILCAIGLLAFPLGTLINAYFLYLLAGEPGRRVLSPEYQQIVAATPHIRYGTHWAVVLVLLLVLLLTVGLIVAVVNA